MGGYDLALVGEASAVGAIDLGARQCLDGKLHHEHVDPDHDAEKRDQHEKHLASGQRLRRNQRSIHTNFLAILWRHEVISRRGNLTEPDIGDMERHRNRFLGVVLGWRGDEKSEFGGLIPSKNNHGPIRRNGIGADNVEHCVMRSIDVDRDHAIEAPLESERFQGPIWCGACSRPITTPRSKF